MEEVILQVDNTYFVENKNLLSKNIVILLFFLLSIILNVFIIAGEIVSDNSILLLKIILLAMYIIDFVISYKKFGFCSLKTFILLSLLLFNLSGLFFSIFGLYDFKNTNVAIQKFVWENQTIATTILYFQIFLTIFWVYIILSKEKERKIVCSKYDTIIAKIFFIIFIFSFPFAVLYRIRYAIQVLQLG